MPEPLDRVTKEMMEAVGPKIFRQIGSQLESLHDAIALNPADQEVTDVLGIEATLTVREAYRYGHQSGWFKGEKELNERSTRPRKRICARALV